MGARRPAGRAGRRPGAGVSARGARVVNLCFHGIGTPGRPLEPDEERYWVSAEQFDELLAEARRHPQLRISFDDGNASDAEIALPALARASLTASFFVVAGRIGAVGSLSAAGLRELVDGGMTVGTHGQRHRPWRSLGDAELHEELVDARETIAEAAGRPVSHASCPFGAYDRHVLRALRRSGYERVFTVDEAPARADAWLQPRYTIRSTDTPTTIERLAGSDGSVTTSLRMAVKRWR
jgi:peptidoglycan/xylan/chitin deacetylase (PgdA/CDA1 family)